MAEPATGARRQTWSAGSYDTHARFVSDLAGGVMEWLDPKAGEHILDLGCGDGVLTAELAEKGAVVRGVDSSEDFVTTCRARGLEADLMDGQDLTFENEFDAVFSNAALHWMTRAGDVVKGVRKALRPGGRFVAEFGGHGNVAAIVTAMRAVAMRHGGDLSLAMPWYFPSPDCYRGLLEEHGFEVRRISLIPRPVVLKTGIEGWLMLFRKPFFQQFESEAENVLRETIELLRPALRDGDGNWTADYVRLRVEAVTR